MNFEQLRVFRIVAEEKSFSRAASRLFVSSSALIQRINVLEQELGARLFARTPKGVTLTPAGSAFYLDSQEIINAIDSAQQKAKLLDSMGNEQILKLGTSTDEIITILPTIYGAFKKKHPHAAVTFVATPNATHLDDVNNGVFDLCLFPESSSVARKGLEFVPLYEDRLCCYLPPKHRLSDRPSLSLQNLSGEHVVLNRTTINVELEKKLHDEGAQIDVSYIDTNDQSTGLDMMLEEKILLFPRLDALSLFPLKCIDFDEDSTIAIGIVHRKAIRECERNFISFAVEFVSDIADIA